MGKQKNHLKNIKPYTELEKCAGCKETFKNGQECWAIKYKGGTVIHACSTCWKKYTKEKFTFAW